MLQMETQARQEAEAQAEADEAAKIAAE